MRNCIRKVENHCSRNLCPPPRQASSTQRVGRNQSQTLTKTCNLNIWKVEAERSEVQCYPQPHNKFEASLALLANPVPDYHRLVFVYK